MQAHMKNARSKCRGFYLSRLQNDIDVLSTKSPRLSPATQSSLDGDQRALSPRTNSSGGPEEPIADEAFHFLDDDQHVDLNVCLHKIPRLRLGDSSHLHSHRIWTMPMLPRKWILRKRMNSETQAVSASPVKDLKANLKTRCVTLAFSRRPFQQRCFKLQEGLHISDAALDIDDFNEENYGPIEDNIAPDDDEVVEIRLRELGLPTAVDHDFDDFNNLDEADEVGPDVEEEEEVDTQNVQQANANGGGGGRMPKPATRTEEFEGAGRTYGRGLHLFDRIEKEDRFSEERNENPFYPFASRMEWDFGDKLESTGASMASIDGVLHSEYVRIVFTSPYETFADMHNQCQKNPLYYNSAEKLRELMELLPGGPKWRSQIIELKGGSTKRPLFFFYRSTLR